MLTKRLLTTAILIFLFCIAVFSQTENQDNLYFKNELGIDVANVLTFLERDNQSYLINYKRHFKNNTAIRVGFNLDISTNNDKGKYFDSKLGYEAYLVKDKWQIIGGIDASYSYDGGNFQPNDLTILGLSPLVGVKYHVSKHFSIATECKLNFLYSMYRNSESFDPNANRDEFDVNIGTVGMIIISYHFNLKK
jgi:hypothetical protein